MPLLEGWESFIGLGIFSSLLKTRVAPWPWSSFMKCQPSEHFLYLLSQKTNDSFGTGHPCNVVVSVTGPRIRQTSKPQPCYLVDTWFGQGTSAEFRTSVSPPGEWQQPFPCTLLWGRHLPPAVQWLYMEAGESMWQCWGRAVLLSLAPELFLSEELGPVTVIRALPSLGYAGY